MTRVLIDDVAEILNGYAFDSDNFNTTGNGLPIVRIRDVVPGISETYYLGDFPEEYILQNGDILIGMDGEFNIANWKGGKALLNQRVCKVTPRSEIADASFLKYRLSVVLKEIEANTPSVTVKHLSSEDLKQTEIEIPSLSEQRRIAAVLDRADRLRRTRRYAAQLSETFLQTVFVRMFGDALKPGHPSTQLGDLVKITGGGTPSREVEKYYTGKIPWLTSKDMRGEYIYDTQEHITEEAIKESATNLVPVGSILMVVKSKVLMHRLPLAITKVPMCHGQDIKSIQCSDNVSNLFIVQVLKYNEARLLLQARGANTEGLTLPMIQEVPVPYVPLALQEKFARIVQQFERLRAQQREAERQAEHLFQTLLHRAFEGEYKTVSKESKGGREGAV